jgi:hypothetical protein
MAEVNIDAAVVRQHSVSVTQREEHLGMHGFNARDRKQSGEYFRAQNSSLRNVDFPLYQDLLLIITKEPIFTLHIARLFSSLISSSRALDMIISWVFSPTTLSSSTSLEVYCPGCSCLV